MKTHMVRLTLCQTSTSISDNILCAQAAPASTLLATAPKSRQKGPAL